LNHTTIWTCDAEGNELAEELADNTTPGVSKNYHAVDWVLTIDNANAELTYTYDAAGQNLSEEQKS
jgi:YD repeat-containing protein